MKKKVSQSFNTANAWGSNSDFMILDAYNVYISNNVQQLVLLIDYFAIVTPQL